MRWRTDLLLEMASILQRKYGGVVPTSKAELLSLPGVGEYIAGATLCFSKGEPEILLDTNIVRVLGRVYGLPISEASRRSSEFRVKAQRLLVRGRARETYFALIDLAAAICLPRIPRCEVCPIAAACAFGRRQHKSERQPKAHQRWGTT